MRWNTVLFDLDGTVTDPKVGITQAAASALRQLGRGEIDPDTLTAFIGPPLHESFPALYGLNEAETDEAIRCFRDYYTRQGWAENIPYPGMAALLTALRQAGLRLAIATSKPEDTAVRILEHFGLAEQFDLICGSSAGDKASAGKASVVRDALRRLGEGGAAVMVGDRSYDVVGAHTVGLPAVGVLYGYGSRQELADADADFIAADLNELKAILLQE